MRALLTFIAIGISCLGAAQAAAPEWTDDLAKMKIPDAKASGKINGKDFTHDKASFTPNVGVLELRSGKEIFADQAILIFIKLEMNATIEEKKFEVTVKSESNPHIHLKWKVEGEPLPKGDAFTGKYAMKLEFGKKKDGKIPGKIYVCLPDEKKTVVAGTFEVEMK